MSARLTSMARTVLPLCAAADNSTATAPATWGAAMLVPLEISSPVRNRGTLEYATPGAHTSGLKTSPPRALHHPTSWALGSIPFTNAPGSRAQTEMGCRAEPGNPTVDRPGPSLPALITKATSGCFKLNSSISESIAAVPSRSFPTPKLRLSTRRMARRVAKSTA